MRVVSFILGRRLVEQPGAVGSGPRPMFCPDCTEGTRPDGTECAACWGTGFVDPTDPDSAAEQRKVAASTTKGGASRVNGPPRPTGGVISRGD